MNGGLYLKLTSKSSSFLLCWCYSVFSLSSHALDDNRSSAGSSCDSPAEVGTNTDSPVSLSDPRSPFLPVDLAAKLPIDWEAEVC